MNRSISEVEQLSQKNWSLREGNKDYVLLRLRSGLPPGYSVIKMITDIKFFKTGATYRASGFGHSENNTNDHLLRTVDLFLSRSNSNESSSYMPISDKLGVEDKKFFLEFEGSRAARISNGDSGGALFFEGIGSDGKPLAFLAAIITGVKTYSVNTNCTNKASICGVADYGLRVDAFHDDVIRTATNIINAL